MKPPAIVVGLRYVPPKGRIGFMQRVITMHCSKHPKYLGIRPPTADCGACQRIYDLRWL